jgi:hypothetical protein
VDAAGVQTRKFPKAKASSFSLDVREDRAGLGGSPHGAGGAKYWRLNFYERKLVAFRLPADPAAAAARARRRTAGRQAAGGRREPARRNVEDSTVECYLTNGVELLEELPWAGKYIPFVSCFGKVLYVDEAAAASARSCR